VGQYIGQEVAMMKRLSVLALAMVGVASFAHAQTATGQYGDTQMQQQPMNQSGSSQMMSQPDSQAMAPSGDRWPVALTDEYGFRYNSRGDRLDASGRIMLPPMTPPSAAALK
jgi:hypothetical protein